MLAGDLLMAATKRVTVSDAIAWIAEGRPLGDAATPQEVLHALVKLLEEEVGAADALSRLARDVASSSFDPAQILASSELVPTPDEYRKTLDRLAWKSSTKSLCGLDARSVLACQREDASSVAVLCAVAGLTYKELKSRATATPVLPVKVSGPWALDQVQSVFKIVDEVVSDSTPQPTQGPFRARPVEFAYPHSGLSGWEALEAMRRGGVPYETLLVQRVVGGAWSAHRNRTSGESTKVIADLLCALLDDLQISYLRTPLAGGSAGTATVRALVGSDVPNQTGLIVKDASGNPVHAVLFSVANDGGTARSSAARLRTIEGSPLPCSLIVAGKGWGERGETGPLAAAFEGRLYSDGALNTLATTMSTAVAPPSSPSTPTAGTDAAAVPSATSTTEGDTSQ